MCELRAKRDQSRRHQAGSQCVGNERDASRIPSATEQQVVRNYLFRVFEKLGISSRVELVLYCLQQRQNLPLARVN